MGFLPGQSGPGRCTRSPMTGSADVRPPRGKSGGGRQAEFVICDQPIDITYLPTREGRLYLAVVEDLFSRMIVGWSMAETMESRLVVDALHLALARRRPAAGLLAHSDCGSRYASDHNQRARAAAGIGCSMSEVGQCWDNAPVESFFGRLKTELAPEVFATRDQARAELFEYLEVFYNRVRHHSSLGFVSPTEFERAYHLSHP